MAVYDTRFARRFGKATSATNWQVASRAPEHAYLTFPDYAPTPKPSVDTCKELGLAVSCKSQLYYMPAHGFFVSQFNQTPVLTSLSALAAKDGKVQLFSMQTGRLINSPLTKYKSKTDINCVLFDYQQKPGYEEDESQTPTVLVGGRHDVDQWGW